MEAVYSWLLSGDPSIAYLTKKDLLGYEDPSEKSRIGSYGWCAEYLKHRNSDGSWNLQSKFSGKEYFVMEDVGKPSRVITYFALKIMNFYGGCLEKTTAT